MQTTWRVLFGEDFKYPFWPLVDNVANATQVMHQGAYAYFVAAGMTVVVSAIALSQHHAIAGIDGSAFLDAAIFALVGWRVYRLSLPWAIARLVLFLAEKVYQLSQMPSNAPVGGAPLLGLVLLLLYIHAVRAGMFLRRTAAVGSVQSVSE